MILAMDLAIFCNICVQWGFSLGHFTLKIAKFAVIRHFVAPHHPYISACGVDIKLSKMAENSANCIVEWVTL